MMINCIPPSITAGKPDTESFVLAHPDLNVQNILVFEVGTFTALIDWDNVHTVPRCIGYSRYPSWITTDWNPLMYRYGRPACRIENSPEEMDYFRKIYAARMRSLLPG